MVREQLSKVLNIRIAPGELAMLERLAEADGLPMAALIRQLVRREHAARFGDDLPKPARPKRNR
jgi:hypothetical protein